MYLPRRAAGLASATACAAFVTLLVVSVATIITHICNRWMQCGEPECVASEGGRQRPCSVPSEPFIETCRGIIRFRCHWLVAMGCCNRTYPAFLPRPLLGPRRRTHMKMSRPWREVVMNDL